MVMVVMVMVISAKLDTALSPAFSFAFLESLHVSFCEALLIIVQSKALLEPQNSTARFRWAISVCNALHMCLMFLFVSSSGHVLPDDYDDDDDDDDDEGDLHEI